MHPAIAMPANILIMAVLLGVLVLLAIIRGILRKTLVLAALRQGVPDKALARLPDRITLAPCPGRAWSRPADHAALAGPLRGLGFFEVGAFAVPELPGAFLDLHVNLADRAACAVYDHAVAGAWIEFFSWYANGSRVTATNRPPTGLDAQPGTTTVLGHGLGTETLWRKFLAERPAGDLGEMTPESAQACFVAAYAAGMAWRKQKGISEKELERQVAKRGIRMKVNVSTEKQEAGS